MGVIESRDDTGARNHFGRCGWRTLVKVGGYVVIYPLSGIILPSFYSEFPLRDFTAGSSSASKSCNKSPPTIPTSWGKPSQRLS